MFPRFRRWALLCTCAALAVFTTLHILGISDIDSVWPLFQFPDTPDSPLPKDFRWKDVSQRYPVESLIPLPDGPLKSIPRIQHEFSEENPQHKTERLHRLATVKSSFVHSWHGYRSHAWMQDEVLPMSGGYANPFGGWGATLVDSLDTLCIMGMKKEFRQAVKALEKIDFRSPDMTYVNLFETTIRYLGGLLSAHDLCGEDYPVLLEKAINLGEMLYTAFDTPNRMPVTHWDWRNSAESGDQEAADRVMSAELGSLSLEFTRLSQLTGDNKYYDAVQRISDHFDREQNQTRIPGLFPVYLDAQRTIFGHDRTFTFGGMVDSLYEYFPKQYLLLGGRSPQSRRLYERAIEAAKKYIFFRPMNPQSRNILLAGTAQITVTDYRKLEPEGQHLACFTGGMVGLAAKAFDRPDDLEIARKLVDGCIWAYESMPSGIMPESFRAIPCEDEKCEWSQEKWISALMNQGLLHASEGTPEQYIKKMKLAPGFTEISDARYILR